LINKHRVVILIFVPLLFYIVTLKNDMLQKSRISLIALRGLSVLAKFLFTTLFFKYSEADFGTYSLLATTIFLLVFVMGLDFYSYANRAILEPDSHPQKIIFNQFSLYGILYLILLPLVYFIFKWGHFDWQLFWLFYLVLITEHINFEFYRLLFVFKKPLAANVNLFLRNALWVFVAGYFLWIHKNISMSLVLKLWLAGNITALIFSLAVSFQKRRKISLKNFVWDKQWIFKGLLVSLPYLLGTLTFKTIEFADRYLIDYFLDKKAVGVYSFFANMANVLNIVLFTLVISVLYPPLVESIMKKDRTSFQRIFQQFKKEIIWTSFGVGIILAIILPILLSLIEKTNYLHQYYVFVLLLLANIALNLSFLFHFIMYGYKKDWKIFKATAWAALLNIVLNVILIPSMGIGGAALATFLSFLLVAVIKYFDAQKLLKIIRNTTP